MDPSKPGKGILASLEHKTTESPRRSAISSLSPSFARGPALIASSGTLAVVVLAWWIYSGPSPVITNEALPPAIVYTAPAQPEAGAEPVDASAAAAIVDEALPPLSAPAAAAAAPSAALAAMLSPTPIATVLMRRDHVTVSRPQLKAKPRAKQVAPPREQPRRPPRVAPDTDVALLSALVAHTNDRDVIEAHAGDSTATLLQRCRRVGGEEGRLCGIRICASRAGDDACTRD